MDELPTKISSLEIKRRENKGEDDEFKCKKELYEKKWIQNIAYLFLEIKHKKE